MPRLPGSILVTATPTWSLMRVMWYSNGPGMASNCQSNSDAQNCRALAGSPAGGGAGVVGGDLEVRRLTGHRDSSRIAGDGVPTRRRPRVERTTGIAASSGGQLPGLTAGGGVWGGWGGGRDNGQ